MFSKTKMQYEILFNKLNKTLLMTFTRDIHDLICLLLQLNSHKFIFINIQ